MKRIIFLVSALLLTNSIVSEEINENVNNFSQLPDVYNVKVSPNGKMIGVLREIDQERMVSIIDLESKKMLHTHRFIRKYQIQTCVVVCSDYETLTMTDALVSGR